MYFAILWKHPQISIAELNLLDPSRFPSSKKGIALFDTEHPERLALLAGSIKTGRVIKEKDLQEELKDCRIFGIQEDAIGKHLKRTIGVRRFKLVKITHTDREIKEKGKELINLDNGNFGIVDNYQNIGLYEAVDFEKPGRSMQMGMMPSKLAYLLINLGTELDTKADKKEILIWDPFVGSGTTSFLANFMGYDSIGSDINIKFASKNIERRKTTDFAHNDKKLNFFTQNSTEIVGSQQRKNYNKVIIVTEWRLGPIVTKTTPTNVIQEYQKQVVEIYSGFLENMIRSKIPGLKIVMTIPEYIGQHNIIEASLQKQAEENDYIFDTISEVYQRDGQQVGRRICIITQK